MKKLGLLTGLSGTDLVNAAKNFRKALTAFKKNKEEAAKAAEAAKKPGKKPEKAPEPPAPAFSGNKAQRSQISKTIEDALSKGEVDFMEILKNYTVGDLEAYRKLLEKRERGTLSDIEIDEAPVIIEQIDDTLKLLAEAEQSGIKVLGENPDEIFQEAFEKAEKAVREALDKDEFGFTEAEARRADGTLRNFVISEYDFKEGKEHKKVVTSSNPFNELLRAFNVQEFIDSGKFIELLKALEEAYGEGVGNKVTVLRYLKPGEKKAAYHLAFKIEDDSVLRKLYKLRSSESLENLADVPIIRDGENNQTYVLVGRLGHHGDNNSQFEAVTDAVKRLKNQTKFTYKKGNDSYTFNDTGVELYIEKVYSGRFLLNDADAEGKEVMQPVTNLEGYEIGHVVIDRQTGKTKVVGVDTMPLNSHVSDALRRGMVILAVKGSDGIKYPTVARVNRFTPEEVDKDSAAFKEVRRLVENFVKQTMSGTTLAASRAKRELASGKNGKGLLYFGNNSLLFKKNDKNGKVLFSFKNSDGTTSMIINTNKVDDAVDAIVSYLYNKDRNIPFNVSTNASRAVALGMVETPLASTRNFNGSFDLYAYGQQGPSNTGHTGTRAPQQKGQKIMINGTLLDKEDISQMNQLVPNTGTITYAELLDKIATIVSENFSVKDGIEEMTIDGTTYWFIKTEPGTMQESELIAISKGKTEFAWTLHTGEGVKELYDKAKKGRKKKAANKPGKTKVEEKPEDQGPNLFSGLEGETADPEEKSGGDIIQDALEIYNGKPMQTALNALKKDKTNATARGMFEKQLGIMLANMAKALGISNTANAIQQIKDVYLEMAELNPECLMQKENIVDGLTYIADKTTFEDMAYEPSKIDALRDKLLCF